MTRLKRIARRLLPSPIRDGARTAYWSVREWEERRPQEIALRKLLEVRGDVVQDGPFSGMRSLTTMDDGCILPKLLGCYEEEIHHWIEFMIARRPERVIDVGCASGWYTTGFAYRLPDADVIGVDLEPEALARARDLADLNGLGDHVRLIEQRLEPSDLGDLIAGKNTFVLVDIDGPEIDLLRPEVDARLLDADILVEFHDHFDPLISSTIVERFEPTHDISRLFATGRDSRHYRSLDIFKSAWVRDAAVAERRPTNPRQEFALMLRRD